MAIDGQLFRTVLGSFPTGVTVITTVAADGSMRGLTSNAVCAVSINPPLLLFCIDSGALSLSAFLETKAFVVNFLASGRGELATRFASRGADKFRDVRTEPSPHARGAPILLDDTVAYAECLLDRAIEAGDHYVLIGHIEGASTTGRAPLMYYRREYGTWPSEVK